MNPLLFSVVILTFTPGPEESSFFRSEVLPILRENCFECHGPDLPEVEGGLRMNGREAFLRDSGSGPMIEPGNPDASLLMLLVRDPDPAFSMPPDNPLPESSVDVLARWIEQGAPWPESAAAPEFDRDQVHFFEQEIRPILSERCFGCHGAELKKVKGDLRMTGHSSLLRGGSRGPTLSPGDAESSLLIEAVRYENHDLQMPPKTMLPKREIELLERWVQIGAPWPDQQFTERDEPTGIDLETGRNWWAYRTAVRPELPDHTAGTSAIDALVNHRLSEAGLEPNPIASRRELVRRAWFDLVGLPPSPEEVERFVADDGDDAWERLIDRLLEMPQYGERWGRHWLDVVRFGQTNGYERDLEKTLAWRYRDYVISSFNADKPYDRFLREQLAGDEIDPPSSDAWIATGFYWLGVWDSEPDDFKQAVFDSYDDMVRTIGEGFLGLTIGCARCHDHKFDPIPQEDYYGMVGFVRNVLPQENDPDGLSGSKYVLDSPILTAIDATPEDLKKWNQGRNQHGQELQKKAWAIITQARDELIQERSQNHPAEVRDAALLPVKKRSPAQARLLSSIPELNPSRYTVSKQLNPTLKLRHRLLSQQVENGVTSYPGELDWALVARERGRHPHPVHLMVRGRASATGREVRPHFPQVLHSDSADAFPELPERPDGARSTGLRTTLADWVVNPRNPLTTRVLVNRLWQHHFGDGLVATPNNFGTTGTLPTHPLLLDWLATDFVAGGYKIKRMHKLIMKSNAYRRSTRAENTTAIKTDPDNLLLWRQNMRRLDAEVLRDSIMAVSGTLNLKMGGHGFYPTISREVLGGMSRPGRGWGVSEEREQNRRSVYTFIKRTLPPPFMQTFDMSDSSISIARRTTTTIVPQALTLLNGDFLNRQAAQFAARVEREAGNDAEAQVERAFELALSRKPDAAERSALLELLARQETEFASMNKRISLRALVPSRLDDDYLRQLPPEQILGGPQQGWTYLPGEWKEPYNATRAVDNDLGPAAIYEGGKARRNGEIQADVMLEDDCEFGALLFRARPGKAGLTGLELRLDPDAGRVRLSMQQPGGSRELASIAAPIKRNAVHHLKISAFGTRVRVWLDRASAPLLDVTDPEMLDQGGRVGARSWGGAFHLSNFSYGTPSARITVQMNTPGSPRTRALESVCLVLLNLNEFAYVD